MSSKILLAGATGYVGGTVLSTLLNTQDAAIKNASISVLVRNTQQAQVLEEKGISTVQVGDYTDTTAIAELASGYDVIVNGASGFELGLATALIEGLAQRKKKLGVEVHYIHTSGTTNIADSPLLDLYPGYKADPISDSSPAQLTSELRRLDAASPYIQRSVDLAVMDKGKATGVKTHSICLPMLFGVGTGLFRTVSGQIPILVRGAIQARQAWLVGDGSALKGYVHIKDAARVYEIAVSRVLRGLSVPYGEEGVMFVGDREYTWNEVGEKIASVGKALGVLDTDKVKYVSMEEGGRLLGMDDMQYVEAAYVSSARATADIARGLGWKPVYSDAFDEYFGDVWNIVLEEAK
ncbi:NAD-dependent epimerase/dehydratase family protein [Aspergillus puulaauensis]|uniref:NAD-dependent epimerase/dehydratase domain-containing protein n=1 Tax=Aspergillus puulaauensis TaxID=1220207 RepID=A0A7R7XPR9_9EURO|nr:uncharacterized protein APUU_50182S [Aspergillus puulaauensis]BCS25471.1 hypothetical protein APUU_50182S [Aspergillus puulaauensis]